MAIEWKKVTWYSQIIAIVLFVAVFIVGIVLGMKITSTRAAVSVPMGIVPMQSASPVSHAGPLQIATTSTPISATYACSSGNEIQVTSESMHLSFELQNASSTYQNCTQIAAPVSP